MRLIDADALIEQRFKNPISYRVFVNIVKRQPTIEPERKTGIWIERGLSGMVCGSCGYEYECKGTDSENYCPHCGSYNGGEVTE